MTVAPAGVVERLRDLADRGKALVAEGSPGTVDLIELRAETASGLAEVEAALAHEDRSHTVIPDGLRSASAARVIRYLTVHECLLDVLDGIDARLFGSLSLLVSRLRTGDRDSRRQALVDAVRAATHHPVTAAVAEAGHVDVSAARQRGALVVRAGEECIVVDVGGHAPSSALTGYLAMIEAIAAGVAKHDAEARGLSELVKHAAAQSNYDGHPGPAVAGRPPGLALGDLTRREREVATLVSRGLSNPEIAAELVISVETAKSHVKSILRKSGAGSRAEFVTRSARY
ncbi:LuxR C-terminal-related transcriptional regulator [Gordonia sp. NB41Y]|nr:LuxR C-terminal-related transcriptional regulator [Gordonia sp. NB41Y]WLP89060.1 LuxR C-terminal-related transcriptional regulator [Gordonia sp. NB41Y]